MYKHGLIAQKHDIELSAQHANSIMSELYMQHSCNRIECICIGG